MEKFVRTRPQISFSAVARTSSMGLCDGGQPQHDGHLPSAQAANLVGARGVSSWRSSIDVGVRRRVATCAIVPHRSANLPQHARRPEPQISGRVVRTEYERAQAREHSYFEVISPSRVLNGDENRARVATDLWLREFLAKPHADQHSPDPGRAVCPFIPTAIRKNLIRMQVVSDPRLSVESVTELLAEASDDFLKMEPRQGNLSLFKTSLLVFPNLAAERAPEVIDGLQERLKAEFVTKGLMIGEFHALNNAPGLYNPDFKPLRTPFPSLAIRFMVASDLPFLTDTKYTAQQRVTFLEAFLRQDFNKGSHEALASLQAARKELNEHADLTTSPSYDRVSDE